jgi:hypothetical protein
LSGPGSRSGPIASRSVEIFGPPGGGKTSAITALQASTDGVRAVSTYSSPGNAPLYIRAALSLTPVLLARPRATRRLKQLNWMIRLEASPRVAAREALPGTAVMVFDQGPLYTLVRLRLQAPDRARWKPTFERWWDATVDRWSHLLHLAVLLDAPTDVLVSRIKGRSKSHEAKDATDLAARRLVEESRAAHEAVAGELAARGLTILRFDTSVSTVEDVVAGTRALLVGQDGTPGHDPSDRARPPGTP